MHHHQSIKKERTICQSSLCLDLVSFSRVGAHWAVDGNNQTKVIPLTKKTTMHHHTENKERAINLSILAVSGPGEFLRVESDEAAGWLVVGCVTLCVVVVVVVVCRCRYRCVWLWFVVVWWCVLRCVCVRCGAVWCDTMEKRSRVYVQNAHMCKHTRVWCRYTWGRFECTHGDVLNVHTECEGGRSSSVLLTKICPRGVFTCPRG